MVADLRTAARADATHADDALAGARRIVVKIGSALLVDPEKGLRVAWLDSLIGDVAALRAEGRDVLLVSSGAIALGRRMMGLGANSLALEEAQAAASVGQIALARAYAERLEGVGLRAGQALLTLGDTQDRRRYLNACATLKTLLGLGVVPVVNENDAVATDEIRYGDNDRLAARVATMAGADLLILLSDVDGLYDGDPRKDPSAKRLERVREITPEIEAMASGPGTPGARGGMVTKILAAKTAAEGGCAMLIAQGRPSGSAFDAPGAGLAPLAALRAGAPHTRFDAAATPQSARKTWIAGLKPMGALHLDDGAVAALARGASVLPAGVFRVEGAFERGDPVSLKRADGATLGAALSGYSADEARLIVGRKSNEIARILGHGARKAAAHRDDLAVWDHARDKDRETLEG